MIGCMSNNRTLVIHSSLLILLLGLNLLVLASETTKNNYRPNEKKVLIAAQKSRFKEAVMLKVREVLQEDGYPVKTISLKELRAESADNYQAIVIVNTCWAWRLNGHVRRFLSEVHGNERKKIVLLTTAASGSWHPKLTDVDAITSASMMTEAGCIADNIINRVRILLEPE